MFRIFATTIVYVYRSLQLNSQLVRFCGGHPNVRLRVHVQTSICLQVQGLVHTFSKKKKYLSTLLIKLENASRGEELCCTARMNSGGCGDIRPMPGIIVNDLVTQVTCQNTSQKLSGNKIQITSSFLWPMKKCLKTLC